MRTLSVGSFIEMNDVDETCKVGLECVSGAQRSMEKFNAEYVGYVFY